MIIVMETGVIWRMTAKEIRIVGTRENVSRRNPLLFQGIQYTLQVLVICPYTNFIDHQRSATVIWDTLANIVNKNLQSEKNCHLLHLTKMLS